LSRFDFLHGEEALMGQDDGQMHFFLMGETLAFFFSGYK
jgi:hypothetical protein